MTNFRRSVRLLPCLLCGAAVILPACSKSPDETTDRANTRPVQNAPDAPASAPREAVIGFDSIGLVDPELHVEPSKQGWDAEIINDAADTQLKILGSLLVNPRQLDARHVSELADAQYRGGPLRPRNLTVAFEDASLLVRRASIPDKSGTDESGEVESTTHHGQLGFVEALRDLVEPLESASEVRAKFKIFRVDASRDEATSRAYYELSGRTDAGIFQQRATWECRWRRRADAPPLLLSIAVTQYEEALGKSPGATLFVDCTEAVLGANPAYHEQLASSTDYWLDRLEFRFGIDPSGWLGLAVGDVNGDGLDDLYLCQPGGLPNRLFVQHTDGTAEEMSTAAGVDWLDHTHAALIVDLDNDSNQDLVLGLKLGLIIMSGDGNGHFDVKAIKLTPESSPYSLSAADFDDDGDLDIYACCYGVRRRDPERRFLRRPIPYHDANNGGRNVLFRNNGAWRFQDVTKRVGLEQNNRRFSFAASWDDYDNDGDLDLYVANDYGRNNLYRNDRGRFTDIARLAGVEDISAGMSVSWGDYNNDGWMDLYVSNMFSSAGNRIAYQRRFHSDASEATRSEFQRHARGNSLFQNAGDGTFRDVSTSAGVTMGRWAWGSGFVDINNDGLEDLIVANGFVTQEDPGDL